MGVQIRERILVTGQGSILLSRKKKKNTTIIYSCPSS